MASRIATWVLYVVCVVQVANLWSLPEDIAAQQLKFWTDSKTTWEATDPAKSDTLDWTAKAKERSLARISEILANPDELLFQARYEWVLWLLSAVLAAVAAFAARQESRHWPWLVGSLVALLIWLTQPWRAFGMFFVDGEFDLNRGVHQIDFISEHSGWMVAMIFFNAIAPIVLVVLAVYGTTQMVKRARHAL